MTFTSLTGVPSAGSGVWVSWDVAKGRLDAPAAIRAWRKRLGLGGLFW